MKQFTVSIIAAGVLALSGAAVAKQSSRTGGRPLTATLTGAAEVPPGDPDATGRFSATINRGHNQLCYNLNVAKIDTPTAAHIHEGAAGQNGSPVVMLMAPAKGSSKGCVSITSDLAMKLIQTPQDYYVNVHNAQYANGGLRGQLRK